MSKHTPGDWQVYQDSIDEFPGIEAEFASGSFSIVLYGEADEDDLGIHGRTKEEQFANARLIASAPDLLAACKAAEPYIFNAPLEGALDVHAILMSAIAKAEGAN